MPGAAAAAAQASAIALAGGANPPPRTCDLERRVRFGAREATRHEQVVVRALLVAATAERTRWRLVGGDLDVVIEAVGGELSGVGPGANVTAAPVADAACARLEMETVPAPAADTAVGRLVAEWSGAARLELEFCAPDGLSSWIHRESLGRQGESVVHARCR